MQSEWIITKPNPSFVYRIVHLKCKKAFVWMEEPFKYFCSKCHNRAPDWIIVQVQMLNEKT